MRKDLNDWAREARENGEKYFYIREREDGTLEKVLNVDDYHYEINMSFNRDIYEQWVGGIFTKIVCEAKNKNQLMKAVRIAEEIGLEENKDFFIIRDCCLTELTPEEFDENGIGRTITAIGFAPMDTSIVEKISKKFQLLK
jgi:PTH2 family peptidyl-tRNA hydrolase